MGRKSSITRLDPRIQQAVGELIRDGRATIDEILERIKEMGGEASRSAVGRHVKSAHQAMKQWTQMKELHTIWAGKLKDEPDSDMSRLLLEIMKTLAFKTMADLGDDSAAAASPMDLMLLGKMLDHVTRAQKISVDQALKLRKEFATEAADVAVEEAQKAGASEELIETIKRRIMGIGEESPSRSVSRAAAHRKKRKGGK